MIPGVMSFVFCYFPFILGVLKSFFVKESVNINCKMKPIKYASCNFLEKVIEIKNTNVAINATNSPNEAVIVNTGHHFHNRYRSVSVVNTGEDELEKVENTGTKVAGREVLEDDIRTTELRLEIAFVSKEEVFPA